MEWYWTLTLLLGSILILMFVGVPVGIKSTEVSGYKYEKVIYVTKQENKCAVGIYPPLEPRPALA